MQGGGERMRKEPLLEVEAIKLVTMYLALKVIRGR
jgi:hypothetical protein